MYYRHKKNGTHYLTYTKSGRHHAYVTTLNTSTPFLVKAENVEVSKTPFGDNYYGKQYELTAPRNFGRYFYRDGVWVKADFINETELEDRIIELESQVRYIANAEARQTGIDYLAALTQNLMELIHARTT